MLGACIESGQKLRYAYWGLMCRACETDRLSSGEWRVHHLYFPRRNCVSAWHFRVSSFWSAFRRSQRSRLPTEYGTHAGRVWYSRRQSMVFTQAEYGIHAGRVWYSRRQSMVLTQAEYGIHAGRAALTQAWVRRKLHWHIVFILVT